MERVVVCASSFSSLLPECRSNILLPASSSSPRRRTSVVVKSLNSVDSSSSSSSSDQAVEASTTTSNDGRSSRDLLLASAVDVPPFSLISYANIKKAFTAERKPIFHLQWFSNICSHGHLLRVLCFARAFCYYMSSVHNDSCACLWILIICIIFCTQLSSPDTGPLHHAWADTCCLIWRSKFLVLHILLLFKCQV